MIYIKRTALTHSAVFWERLLFYYSTLLYFNIYFNPLSTKMKYELCLTLPFVFLWICWRVLNCILTKNHSFIIKTLWSLLRVEITRAPLHSIKIFEAKIYLKPSFNYKTRLIFNEFIPILTFLIVIHDNLLRKYLCLKSI